MGVAGRRSLGLAAPDGDCKRLMEDRRHSCSLSAGCHAPSPTQANARRTTINARQPPPTVDRCCRKLWPSRQDILSISSFSRWASLQPKQGYSPAQNATNSYHTYRRRQGSQEKQQDDVILTHAMIGSFGRIGGECGRNCPVSNVLIPWSSVLTAVPEVRYYVIGCVIQGGSSLGGRRSLRRVRNCLARPSPPDA